MASRFPAENKVQLRVRRGHDMTWSCDIHGDPIKFYCKEHVIAICHPCATKDHQKPCHLENIEDVILETKKNLEDSQKKITEAKERLKTLEYKIESSSTSSTHHLLSVNDDVHAIYDEKLKSVKDKERDKIRLINEEADEEIRIIDEKREKRIKACKEEAAKQQRTIEESQTRFISDIRTICDKVKKNLGELRSKNQHKIDIVNNMDSKIERIKQDDKILVNEAPQVIASLDEVIASLDESFNSNVYQEVADYIDQIAHEVKRVKFFESEVGGKHYRRIDGYIGKWYLVKSIDIPSIVKFPRVFCLISHEELVLNSGRVLYVTNINSELTKKVIQVDDNVNIIYDSCAPMDGYAIVYGKWGRCFTGDCFDGCITVYDRQWKVTRDISIPRNTSSASGDVYVDVDRDGMILAAQYDQSNIYVINPDDGKVVKTITMQSKKVWERIQALSSGDIVVQTYHDEITVISRSGEEKAVICCAEWSRCNVDKLTDTLYITYRVKEPDEDLQFYAVDQVSCDGNIQARRIVEYKQSDRSFFISPCLVTPSGNLVACSGDKLLIYKKGFTL